MKIYRIGSLREEGVRDEGELLWLHALYHLLHDVVAVLVHDARDHLDETRIHSDL